AFWRGSNERPGLDRGVPGAATSAPDVEAAPASPARVGPSDQGLPHGDCALRLTALGGGDPLRLATRLTPAPHVPARGNQSPLDAGLRAATERGRTPRTPSPWTCRNSNVHGMALMIDVGLRHPIDDDARQRRRKRWIFPVAVFGRSSTTSMRSGIL